MKKLFIILILPFLGCFLFCPVSIGAQEDTLIEITEFEEYPVPVGEGASSSPALISIAVGGKSWFSKIYDESDYWGQIEMYGVDASIDFNEKFGVGISYLQGTGNGTRIGRSLDMDRLDLDIALKYHICPYLSAYLDFKRIDFDYVAPLPGKPKFRYKYEDKFTGVGIGIAGAVPIWEGFYIYAGGGYIPFTSYDSFNPEATGDIDVDYYYNAEAGVGYFLPLGPVDIMGTVGWRVQVQRLVLYMENIRTPDGPQQNKVERDFRQEGITLGLRLRF